MAEERSVTRSFVRVEISETSLVDLKRFDTENGGRVIVGGKCLCFFFSFFTVQIDVVLVVVGQLC